MKKCSKCGDSNTTWWKNYPCTPVEAPNLLWQTDFSNPEISAQARGFNAGDLIRNSHGHVAIVTYASDKCGDIICRLRGKYTSEYVSSVNWWRVIKKANPTQAQRWLQQDASTKL